MLRKTVFWLHLCCGVIGGLIILMMSASGVILTYERQILAWQDRVYYQPPPPNASRLAIDELLSIATSKQQFEATSITLENNPAAPVIVREGRSASYYINPYSAQIYTPRSDSLDRFFSVITRWHRWFNTTDASRVRARAITGAANLLFLGLVLSGMYLWLPAIFKRATMRMRIWFHPNAKSASARDFNWHHVFGFWAAIPLLVIISSATVFNYSWANDLVYFLAGDDSRKQAAAQTSPTEEVDATANENFNSVASQSLEQLFLAATDYKPDWRRLTLTLPQDVFEPQLRIGFDQGNGGQAHKRHNLTLDRASAAVEQWAPFDSLSPGRQIRSWLRFLHTGEALGLIGQSLAGMASIAASLLVWTGLSLSLRRFLAFRKRIQKKRAAGQDISLESS